MTLALKQSRSFKSWHSTGALFRAFFRPRKLIFSLPGDSVQLTFSWELVILHKFMVYLMSRRERRFNLCMELGLMAKGTRTPREMKWHYYCSRISDHHFLCLVLFPTLLLGAVSKRSPKIPPLSGDTRKLFKTSSVCFSDFFKVGCLIQCWFYLSDTLSPLGDATLGI